MGMRGPGARPVRKAEKQAKERPKRRRWQRKGLTRAGRVIAFIEGLKLTAGRHAGKPFKLRPWQRADIEAIYATDADGRRMVRQALETMARKNGKTQLASALALAHLAGPEAEPRGEVYSAATDRNQAGRVFREMEATILADPDLADRCNIQRFAKRIEVMSGPGAGSVYEALSSDARKAHSLSPSFVICDELAQWLNRDLFDNLVTGTGARDEPLVIVISTQSADPNHVMSELVAYGRSVLDGTIDDETFHAAIYAVPDDADIWDEKNWHLANPALGDFRSLEELRQFAEKAKRIPAREAVFRNLYLNQSISTEARFISAADWKACGAAVDRAALAGRPCWAGLDLSSTTDLTSLVLLFPEDDFAALPFFWLPAADIEAREQRDHVPYRVWRDKGLIEFTPGRAIDKRAVALRLAEIAGEFDLRGLAFDRWRMKDLQKILDDEGIDLPLVEFGQGYQSMGPAVDQLETLVLDQQLRHGMNPVLTWNVASAIVTSDPAGNRKLDKARSIARIDGLVALAMAAGLQARQPAPTVYSENSVMVIAV
jgi:phage terminase large subunit-like protein